MRRSLLLMAVIFMMACIAGAQGQTTTTAGFSKQTVTATKGISTQAGTQVTSPRNCATMEHLAWMKQQDPTLEARMQAEEKKFNEYIAEHQQELENSKTTYTMPTVVHVVYKTTSSGYVSPTRVTEQINQTNSDWAGTNGRSMEAFNTSLRVDCGVTLCLATKDPSGNATTGIDYVQTTVSSWTYDDHVKHSSYGGANAWDPTKYLNIWVCNLGSSLCGYAQFPTSGINATFGVVIHYQFFGLTGASAPYNLGGTTSHEFGHCFNLYHIWGDDGGSCSGTDQCNDTPNQASENYGNHSGVLTDACSTSSPGIMYMNFMDYSDDIDYTNMTPNQSSRMQAAISTYLSGVAGNASNACSTGPSAPVANFSASATSINPGGSVTFSDLSSNSPTSWAWTFGDGGTSTTQNPSHTYATVGTYTVSLTATNSIGSDSETKNAYITVTNGTTQTCDTLHYPLSGTATLYSTTGGGYVAGNNEYGDLGKADYFDTYSPYTKIYGAYFWFGHAVASGSENITFNVYNGTSGTPGAVIGSATVPLSTIVSNTNSSLMTGVSFATPVTIPGAFFVGVVLPTTTGDTIALVTNTDGDTSPGTAWELWSDNTWYAYSDASSWGLNMQNAIFPVVCSGVPGFPEIGTLESILIYPNPANDILNINMVNYGKNDVKIEIYNSMGALVKTMNGNTSVLSINMSDEVSGIYYVTLTTDEGTITRKVSLIK
jgi:PKD repeat protein